MPEPLQQVCVSLPPSLIVRLQQGAVQTDRTLGGMIRHLVSEWARATPLPEGGFPDAVTSPYPAVKADATSIAEAKIQLGELEQERERILQKQRRWSDTAADGTALDQLNLRIDLFRKNITMAERMMPRRRNGGDTNG
jgi:hypothetical protein